MRTTCSILGCDRTAIARGWCYTHYKRWQKHGDPNFLLFKQSKAGAPMEFIAKLPLEGDGCVLWPFTRNNEGYGQINLGAGKKALVTRLICEKRNGPPPSRKHHAAHSCGNGNLGCIAPWHLEWKTAAANAADKIAHGTHRRGEMVPNSKLTEQQIREIRSLDGAITHTLIGKRFGVTQSLVSRIVRREAWSHVQ